jgi:hypothetical protein
MDIKTELKNFIHERFKPTASPLFIERALKVIEGAPNDKKSLNAAADKVGKMVSLFIDKNLGKEIYGKLKEKIDNDFPES